MTRISSGSVSHAVCVRRPIARPAANAASTISRPVAASSAGATSRVRQPRCRANAAASSAWTPSAAARPGASLSGRLTVTSASGQAIARMPAASAVSASPLTARASGCIATISTRAGDHRQQRERRGLDRHGGPRRRHHPAETAERVRRAGDDLRRGDEHRVARRMRLVLRDVEVAHAEREVDGVDVVEMTGAGDDVHEQGEQPDRERQPRPPAGVIEERRRAPARGRVRLGHGCQPITRSGMRSLRLPVR